MSKRLLLSRRIQTAQIHLRSQIEVAKSEEHIKPLTILLPSAAAIDDLRHQLGDTIGVRLYQFYGLGAAILEESGNPIHEIGDPAIRRLIRKILAEMNMAGKLGSFAAVWEKPGFIQVILDWIREMKSQGITPVQYDNYASGEGDEQDRQLAEIYTRYQDFMHAHQYSDADGLLWVATEALEADQHLFNREGLCYVLGFDQYTPVQLRILGQLADRFEGLTIYMVWDENRPEDSLALVRMRRTRDELLRTIPLITMILPEEPIPGTSISALHQVIFEDEEPQPVDPHSLKLIEAPSREAEVRRAVLEIKRLLLRGVTPVEVAVLAPDPGTYLPIVQTVSSEYGVPMVYESPLTHNPAIAALVNLLNLGGEFSWQGTFEALQSPYIRQIWLLDEQVEWLAQLTRERPVVAGLEQWLFALRPLQTEDLDIEDEDLGPPLLVASLPPEQLTAIEGGLTTFFMKLSPPEKGTYREYSWWIQTALLGLSPEEDNPEVDPMEITSSLDMAACCQQNPFPQRDLMAVRLVIRAMRQLVAAADTVPTEEVIPWETYRAELLELLSRMQIVPESGLTRVRFGKLEAGRAQVVNHLFVLGLSEGEFPSPPAVDVLYAPQEREQHPLPLVRYIPADDASLWWQVIGNVSQKLTLLRPYIDDNGALWQPSPYWDTVQNRFRGLKVERIPIADHPSVESAASLSELLVAITQTDQQEIPFGLKDIWSFAQDANQVMQQRQSYKLPFEFEGVIQSEELIDQLAKRFGPGHVWSASRLNRFANCPYGFYAEHVLKLEAHHDPEEGIDVMQRGSILHAVLEHLYRQIAEAGLSLTNQELDNILQLLDESCRVIFSSAPLRYSFRPGALWRYEQTELQRMLRILVTWECQGNGESARYSPYRLEAGFGIKRSSSPALDIEVDGIRFRLRGLIDRLDRDENGNMRVVDYKSGSTRFSKTDLEKGLALQTVLYALAAEEFWLKSGAHIAESHYWHIPTREASGSLKFEGAVRGNELADTVLRQAARSVRLIRSGVFPSAPAKPISGVFSCRSKCDFAPICRVSRQSVYKARQEGSA